MSDNDLLTLDAVTIGYTSSPVVRNLNLTVRNGEVVTLLGPNGAGKTTTLRAISRLLQPMGGAILFEGQDLAWPLAGPGGPRWPGADVRLPQHFPQAHRRGALPAPLPRPGSKPGHRL